MARIRHKGVTRVEVVTMLLAIAILCSIAAISFAQEKGGPLRAKKSMMDATQLEQIHQAMLIFAREFGGEYPRPGLINRLADPDLNRQLPGRGPEDVSANTTANLFACLIAQNYMTPELVISPIERNPKVKAKADQGANSYNYDKYNPVEDTYWDSNFKADLNSESNASYAHAPLADPWVKHWRDGMNPMYPQLGNRGPLDGDPNPDSYTCGPHGHWAGNIAMGDNSVKLLTDTTPEELDGDNLFRVDKDREFDALLTFTKEIKDGKPYFQFD